MNRKLWLAVLFIAALILSGCAPAAQPTEEADPTDEAESQEPTEATESDEATEESVEEVETEAPTEVVSGPLVVLCGMQEDWCQAAVQEFENETGIETDMVRMSSGEALARLQAEKGSPSFDVWYGGPSDGPVAAAAEGLIENYVPANAESIPAEMKDADGIWTGVYVGALSFCSNQELVADLGAEVPTSWADLLDPIFESNIAMADVRTSGTSMTTASVLAALNGGEDGAIEYLKQLNANIFQYTKSGSSPGRMAATGEVAVSIIFGHDCIKFEEETGVDLALTYPEEGTGFEIGQISLIADAPNAPAGKRFIEWALTASAQEIAATVASYQIPTNPDAAVPAQAVSLADLIFAQGFTPDLVAQLRSGNFAERFGTEVRGGAEAPAE